MYTAKLIFLSCFNTIKIYIYIISEQALAWSQVSKWHLHNSVQQGNNKKDICPHGYVKDINSISEILHLVFLHS